MMTTKSTKDSALIERMVAGDRSVAAFPGPLWSPQTNKVVDPLALLGRDLQHKPARIGGHFL